MNKIVQSAKTYKSYIFLGLIILLALKVFIPQLDQLKESIQTLKDADPYWVWLAVIVFFAGLPILAWQYIALAFKKLKFGLTLRVQFAGLFVSKLLPSSLGTITLNMYYFTKKNHSVAEATTVMTMNGITSGIAYLGLLIIAFASSDFTLSTILDDVSVPKKAIFIILAILCILAFIVVKSGNLRQKISNGWQGLLDNLGTYKKRPRAIFIGILTNGVGSFTSLFALYASAHALGVDLSLAAALLAYTFGNIAAGLVPTPGGLGAAEAGIYAGLVIVGVSIPDAVSITMLYRLISYWIPVLPGYYYFWDLRKSLLADFSLKKNYNTEAEVKS